MKPRLKNSRGAEGGPPPVGRRAGAGWAGPQDRFPVLRFGLKFGILMAGFYGLSLLPFCDRLLYAYLEGTAWLTHLALNLLGQHTQVSEITVRSARFAIAIRRGCDAVEPSWFFCAAVLAFPGAGMRKTLGMIGGTVLLHGLNMARIVSLYFVGLHCPKFFGAAHVEIWPALFIVAALALWTRWIGWISAHEGPAHRAPL